MPTFFENIDINLIPYGITRQELFDTFKYCGGDTSKKHKDYAMMCGIKHIEKVSHCICGHYIEENCFITNGTITLVVGNHCIKRYVEKYMRTCDTCDKRHRSRKFIDCKTCRKKKADVRLEKEWLLKTTM